MTATPPTVAVIVCTYSMDRWELLAPAIESVRSQAQAATSIVLVVDHNSALEARARSYFPPDVTVLPNLHARGLSGARNSGVAGSSGELVVFLDDDATADEHWLKELVSWFEKPDVIGVGGSATPAWSRTRPTWFPEEFDWVVGCSYRGLPERVTEVRNPLGCNMAFRREAFEAVGGFRSDFGRLGKGPTGAEETEFCIRLAEHNRRWRVLYVPDAEVRHHVPASRATFRYFLRRCYGEGTSKARLRRVAGVRRGLSAEGRYASVTLVSGVFRSLRTGHVAKGAAILAGFGATLAGFIAGSVSPSRHSSVAPGGSAR
jgi:cellulose synthase/poly-beta-1,6-N-acetylglucosamine synthase-like glycosyltransferase